MKRIGKDILCLLLLLLLLSSCGKSYFVTTVGYDGAGSTKVKEGSVYTISSVERDGYALMDIIDQNKQHFRPGDTIEITADLTLTYKWLEESPVEDFKWKINEDHDVTILEYQSDSLVVCVPKYIKGLLVTEIADECFEYSDIQLIVLPDSVTSIGEEAFAYCESLISIDIPAGVTSIGEEAFAYCESLTSIDIPASITSIGEDAFAFCESLTSIDIPAGINSIGDGAFYCCSSLESVSIPSTIMSLGDYVFNGCPKLRLTVRVVKETPVEYFNWEVNEDNGITILEYKSEAPFVYIPKYIEGKPVTCIGTSAFGNCYSLKSIDIPDSVTSIEERAFCGCERLTLIDISDSVISIGDSAFGACFSLTSIEIPSSVEEMGSNIFLLSSIQTITVNKKKSECADWNTNWLQYCTAEVIYLPE